MDKFDFKKTYAQLSKSHIFIIIISCSVLFYASYFFDISSLISDLIASLENQHQLMDQYDQTYSKQIMLAANISQFNDIKDKLTYWQKRLPKSSDVPELLDSILKLGAENGLQFNLFNPAAEIKETGYIRIPLKIVVVGNYNQIASFVSAIANINWVVSLNKFIMTKKMQDGGGVPNHLSAEINLDIYELSKEPIPNKSMKDSSMKDNEKVSEKKI